jgi:periplasmic copper chaperone A
MNITSRAALTGVTTLILLATPAAAQAHVTLQPKTAAAGAYTVENVRVPNETGDAVTTKVDVQLPPGFASASYEAVSGWTVAVTKRKLATPVQTDDGPVNEEVGRITWTADRKADGVQPGQFRDFPLSVQIPGKAGDTLTFKALQTYSDGEVVRWIGTPDADHPAPQVAVLAAANDASHATVAKTAAVTSAPAAHDDDGASKGLAIAALVAGLLGIAIGGAALVRRRA